MLETIAQIASGVCALTAVTTSFRALGKSRELHGGGRHTIWNILSLYLAVTVIWSVLSIFFISPLLFREWKTDQYAQLFLHSLLFMGFLAILLLIWRKILSQKNERGGLEMRYILFSVMISIAVIGISFARQEKQVLPAPNGIDFPEGYKGWRMVAPSSRADNGTIRVVLGNDTAAEAIKNKKTVPWADGTILAKIVWKNKTHEKWQAATIPGEFVHAEFMVKDSKKYSSTGGWGFARWKGLELKPYGDDASFAQECFDCHMPVKDNDYVFTYPAVVPD